MIGTAALSAQSANANAHKCASGGQGNQTAVYMCVYVESSGRNVSRVSVDGKRYAPAGDGPIAYRLRMFNSANQLVRTWPRAGWASYKPKNRLNLCTSYTPMGPYYSDWATPCHNWPANWSMDLQINVSGPGNLVDSPNIVMK
jgi:hypothetical protein